MNGYEIENEYPGKVKRGDFKAKWDRSLWAGKEDVAKALEDKTILVDVREDEEFNGSTSSPYGVDFVPRKGRLPGAIHINWKALFAKDQ
jgi:thiosulfate/3-mercaptopyruvate sulfurtransferase